MSKKRNDLTADLTAFIQTAVDLIHLLSFLPWQLRMAEHTVKKMKQNFEKLGGQANLFGTMTGSSIINIFHDGYYITRTPAGVRFSLGADIDRMAAEVEGRFIASLLCSLHESWEVLVKSLYAKMLWHLQDEFPIQKQRREGFHAKQPDWRTYRNTPKYFNDYALWACSRDCSEPLKAFRTELDWRRVRVRGWLAANHLVIDWLDVPRMLAFCRHCIVHSNGRVIESRLKKLDKSQIQFVQSMMKKTVLTNDDRILPNANTANRLIEAMLSLAYGLYILLSKRCGLKVEFTLGEAQKSSAEID